MEREERRLQNETFKGPTLIKGLVCACGHDVNVKCEPGDESRIREDIKMKLCPDCAEGLQRAQKVWAKEGIKQKTKLWLPEHYNSG